MKIGIILGTRPEIIKVSSLIRRCEEDSLDYFIVHTNQHYSENMDKIFFEELDLPQPHYNLGIGSGSHGDMTGRMMIEMEKVFEKEKPTVILVEGDTNTVLAGALVASKMDIMVGHVEAGLRSYDRTMPEEINRILTDHVSDYLFAPTETQREIAIKENIEPEKCYVVGNTVVDAVHEGLEIAKKKSDVLKRLELKGNDYILMTSHRPATTDNSDNLHTVIEAIAEIAEKHDKQVIFPAHPRTVKMMEKFGVKPTKRFKIIEPVGYLDMLVLQSNSYLIATDSGGLQEESCILEKKCIVIRDNTERPEAVEVGGCVLVGNSDKNIIKEGTEIVLRRQVDWYNPFGDGKSGRHIVNILSNKI